MRESRIKMSPRPALLATGGLLGALAVSSCCVLPLAFALTGISGAWIGTLTKLAPYQPIFLAIAVLSIGLGFWRAYTPRSVACDGAECGTRASRLLTKSALWLSSAIVVIAATVNWWAGLLA